MISWAFTCRWYASSAVSSALLVSGSRRRSYAKLIVLGTSQLPWRQRYTIAHELCHLLSSDDQELHLDKNVFDKAQSRDPSEARANSFAAAFLMPEDRLLAAAGTTGLSDTAFAELACDLEVPLLRLPFG